MTAAYVAIGALTVALLIWLGVRSAMRTREELGEVREERDAARIDRKKQEAMQDAFAAPRSVGAALRTRMRARRLRAARRRGDPPVSGGE